MKLKLLRLLAAGLLAAFAAGSIRAAAMTNADIVKLVQANVDEKIILTAIDNSEPKYDTSAQGLIELSNAKVPQAIISAVIRKSAPAPTDAPPAMPPFAAQTPAPAAPAAAPAPGKDVMSPSEIIMIDGDKSAPMRYLSPQIRTAARALGFGGVASYAVLRNRAAALRTSNRNPVFLVSVPDQAQPDSYLTVASFAVRPNNSREVMIGGGYMSYSTGIHPDRIIPTTAEKAADQSRAQKGFTIYKITPSRRMLPGEYAVILYTGEVHGMVATWFTENGNSYFDFGVDP